MSAAARAPFTGRKFLWLMIGFFGLVIAVNLVLAVEASRTFTGLVVKNGYVASQDFNKGLAAGRTQAALGWQVDVSDDAGRLTVRARGLDGEPLDGHAATARLARPLDPESATVPLIAAGPGRYAAVDALPPGLWDAEIEIRQGARRYHLVHRLHVQ